MGSEAVKEAHQDLHKQIGCMNVIFQLFDRHHFFASRKPSCHNNITPVPERTNHNVESEIASPCSSTLSSLDQNRTAKPESPKKDSTHLEQSGLSVKTGAKENKTTKHVDSPRPLQQSHDVRDVVKNSMYRETRVLPVMKHIDSPRPCRFSCDGRESQGTSKPTMKLRELPRLSLDSRVRSRSSFLVQNLNEESESSVSTPTTNQEFGSHRRSSSVVAKLMGLEGFPESVSVNDDQVSEDRFVLAEKSVPTSSSCSTEVSRNYSVSQCFRPNKPILHSRLQLELAPWKRSDSSRAPHKSVYSEVKKRITQLELDKSGKDLRALKQILEAMQRTRARLDNQTQELAECDKQQYFRQPMQQKQQHSYPSTAEKRSCSPKRAKSPNPIRQPAKLNVQTRAANSSAYSRDNNLRRTSTPKRNNINPSESPRSLEKKINQRTSNAPQGSTVSGVVSPRLQKKKLVTEKQSPSNIQHSELSRIRRNPIKQPKESESPHRRQKVKSANQRQSSNHISEISSDTGSVQSESNNSSASYMETEVIHREKNAEARLSEDTSMAELALATIEQPSPVSVLDAAFYIEDSPSPVKKKISIVFEDSSEAEWHTEELDNLSYSTKHNPGSEFNHKNSENTDKLLHELRLQNSRPCEDATNDIGLFYQSDNSDNRYITKILLASGLLKDLDCVLTTAQLHLPDRLINPKLFHVLEQTEESTWLACKGPQENSAWINFEQKVHRKIVFDTVNEILAHKLTLEGGSLMKDRSLRGQQLLKELYAEIDHLRAEPDNDLTNEDDESVNIIKRDLNHELEDWAGHRGELPALVLDIERLIFKDLITEVISSEVPWLCDRARRHTRQLFTN